VRSAPRTDDTPKLRRMPPEVAVVTDTTHYAPPELLRAHDIHQVSLYVNFGDHAEREADMADFGAFYDRLRRVDTLPHTSQPSIGDLLACYEPLVAAGRDVVSVHIAGGISGTAETARQAADDVMERYPGRRVEVIDSRTACGGIALCAMAASAVARQGGDVDAVAERARAAADAMRIWFAVDTLEFLRRGGRIGTAQAWLGGALKIKPILTVDREITPVERVRTAGRAFDRMVDYMVARRDDGADGWVVQHIQAPDVAVRLIERGREIFGCEPVFVSEIGPVIGTHVGPGLLGVGGIPRALMG
jgi:DegV family protein with EDD domain